MGITQLQNVNEEEGKITLGEYPYTYVRVMTMKSKLFKKGDYDKLLKMGLSEVAAFMEDSDYKPEITEVSQKFSSHVFDKLELVLQRNLARTFSKLRKISPGALKLLIDAYLQRYDYANLKSIIRGKFAGLSKEEVETFLIPVGFLKKEDLDRFMAMESVEKMLHELPFLRKKKVELDRALKHLKEHNSLLFVENLLDHSYLDFVLGFTQRIPVQGALFKDFLEYEIDVLNVKTILRLKAVGVKEVDINEHLFYSGKVLHRGKLQELLKTDFSGVLELLSKTAFKHVVSSLKGSAEKSDFTLLELGLDNYLLKTASRLLHQHPLSVDVILGFLFAKDIEVRNLRTMIKGKQLKLENQFIEQQLVML